MAKLDTSPYKGVRDFYPEDQFIENYIFNTWKKTAESFGYLEYNASVLEPSEIYKEKSGEEIVNEQTFTFTDRGGREVTLRPEMTPTIARMVAAKRRELSLPIRWYSIPNLFRYEATQRGRLREHWQLNVDIFGVESIEADLEVIEVASRTMRNFGATLSDFEIRINKSAGSEINLIDVVKKLESRGMPNVRLDETLARGQAYYNGVVFEFFDTDPANPRSILGGGRYDNLTALFSSDELAASGFGAGDVTIRDFLETHGLLPEYKSTLGFLILPMEDRHYDTAREVAGELREANQNVAVDWTDRKLGDKMRGADKLGVKYAIVIGDEEVESGTYKVKNMETGEETTGSVESLKLELKKDEENSL
jgi:histidyl-tRNA synthetase